MEDSKLDNKLKIDEKFIAALETNPATDESMQIILDKINRDASEWDVNYSENNANILHIVLSKSPMPVVAMLFHKLKSLVQSKYQTKNGEVIIDKLTAMLMQPTEPPEKTPLALAFESRKEDLVEVLDLALHFMADNARFNMIFDKIEPEMKPLQIWIYENKRIDVLKAILESKYLTDEKKLSFVDKKIVTGDAVGGFKEFSLAQASEGYKYFQTKINYQDQSELQQIEQLIEDFKHPKPKTEKNKLTVAKDVEPVNLRPMDHMTKQKSGGTSLSSLRNIFDFLKGSQSKKQEKAEEKKEQEHNKMFQL